MTQFTIVISDIGHHDEGLRGTRSFWWVASHLGAYAELGLYWFLREYFGAASVTLLRPSQLLQGSRRLTTDWLFVGLPTKLDKRHLQRIDFRRLALYDSGDSDGVFFGHSDQELLLSHTNLCLKNWRDRRWRFDYSIGLLPIKRPPLNNKLRLAIQLAALKASWGKSPRKKYDVGFVARPTGNDANNPRVNWLIDLKTHRPNLKLWGGLVGGKKWRKLAEQSGNLRIPDSCWMKRRKVGFFKYFSKLCESKVALAPAGFAPWSYRHFEAIYAKCVVVANDLSHYDFLIPFPREGMVEILSGESVVGGIDRALQLYDKSPEVVTANLAHLNKWLDAGAYSRRCADTLDRFLAQLEGH